MDKFRSILNNSLLMNIIRKPMFFLLAVFGTLFGGFLVAVIFEPFGIHITGDMIVVFSVIIWFVVMMGYDFAKYEDVISIITLIISFILYLLALLAGYCIYVLI